MIGRKRTPKTPSDLSVIRTWLQGLDDESFLALPPATTRGGPFDATDVHVTATEVLADRGLSADTSYVGWHSQTRAWDRQGRLIDLQAVYFGGDREQVRARLQTLPEPFELGGGSSDEEAFTIARRFQADTVDRTDPQQIEAALEPLHHGHWRDGELRFRLDRQLSFSAIDWLHSLVADPAITVQHRSTGFELLAASEAVREDEVESVLAEAAAAYAEPGEGHPPWYAAATSLVPLLVERGRVSEAASLAVRAIDRRPDGWEAELFALAAPSPETLAAAERHGLLLAQARVRAALDGTSPRAEVVAVAEQVRATTSAATLGETIAPLAAHLPHVTATPTTDSTVAPLEQSAVRCAEVLIDPTLPAWLLDRVRRLVAPDLVDLQEDGEWAAYSRSPYHGEEQAGLQQLAAALGESQARLAAELGTAATAWEPPETDDKGSLWKTLDDVRDLTDSQGAWFRATLLNPPADAAAELDAYLLEALVSTKRFTREDADALFPGWRKRFARAHDTYQPVQPALLSFVLGLQDVGHPKTERVLATVLSLKAVWARGIQHVLRALGDDDPRMDLRALIGSTHLQEHYGACVGLVLSEARIRGITPLEALLLLHEEQPRPFSTRALGLELSSPQPRLLNDHVGDSPAHRERAARTAADESLPESFRALYRSS